MGESQRDFAYVRSCRTFPTEVPAKGTCLGHALVSSQFRLLIRRTSDKLKINISKTNVLLSHWFKGSRGTGSRGRQGPGGDRARVRVAVASTYYEARWKPSICAFRGTDSTDVIGDKKRSAFHRHDGDTLSSVVFRSRRFHQQADSLESWISVFDPSLDRSVIRSFGAFSAIAALDQIQIHLGGPQGQQTRLHSQSRCALYRSWKNGPCFLLALAGWPAWPALHRSRIHQTETASGRWRDLRPGRIELTQDYSSIRTFLWSKFSPRSVPLLIKEAPPGGAVLSKSDRSPPVRESKTSLRGQTKPSRTSQAEKNRANWTESAKTQTSLPCGGHRKHRERCSGSPPDWVVPRISFSCPPWMSIPRGFPSPTGLLNRLPRIASVLRRAVLRSSTL